MANWPADLPRNHEAVQALRIGPETVELLGITYTNNGLMRGRIAIPLRRDDSAFVGYGGISPDARAHLKLPKTLTAAQ
jgi:hypothetical protein